MSKKKESPYKVTWKRFKIWRFEFRTNNLGWWFAVQYKDKNTDLHDIMFSKHGIHYQKLPF